MLENVVAWVLNSYVGEFLEDLNTDQLSVALLSGQVELENVPLKKTALRKLDLPLEIRSGLLGKLTLSVPITRLRSEPWTLKLCDMLILLGPPSADRRYDVEAVEQVEQQRKEQMLGELEQSHKTALFDLLGIPTTESQDSWWGASLLSTVANNIQLILNNVHVRYEDDTTLPGGVAFNCGIRIRQVTMQATNSQWKPGFAEPQVGRNVFQKLDVNGFSVYWNSQVKMSTDYATPKRIREILAPETLAQAHIIVPCSAELRMEKNTSKFPLKQKTPRFKFFLRPEMIVCELSRRQMAEIRALNREWARFERARQHRKWRPLTHIGGNAREWWTFAYGRVLEETRRSNANRTWSFASTRARHLNAYSRAYRRRLLGLMANPNAPDTVADPGMSANAAHSSAHPVSIGSMEDRAIMKQIERDAQYSYHELHLFRETVFRRLMREKEKELGISATASAAVEDQFESIDAPPPDEIIIEPDPPPVNSTAGGSGGLYGWITGFFSEQPHAGETQEDKNKYDIGRIDVEELRKMPSTVNVKEMEEEILDVLHESWDDSTLLRRDALLAEISLQLNDLTLRFFDVTVVDSVESNSVLALELKGLKARLELSPREHSLAVDLTVQSVGVQRLQTGVLTKNRRSGTGMSFSASKDELLSNEPTPKVLLSVGGISDGSAPAVPMFSMHYSRRSPRLIVRHVLNSRMQPIVVDYEEGALDGVANIFADDPLMFTVSSRESTGTTIVTVAVDDDDIVIGGPNRNVSASSELSIVESHVFINLEVPKMRMTVSNRGLNQVICNSRQLAFLNVQDVKFNFVSTEPHISKIQTSFGHVELVDLLESTVYPLMSTSDNYSMLGTRLPLSTSCPDLKKRMEEDEARLAKSAAAPVTVRGPEQFVVVSSSVPSESFLDKVPFIQGPPACSQRTNSTLTTGDVSDAYRKASTTAKKPEATITVLLVDRQHAAFESKYKKRNCSIEMEMDDVEMNVNRRTWTALIEMAGLLGVEESDVVPTPLGKQPSDEELLVRKSAAFCVACVVRARACRIGMPFPRNDTRLGIASIDHLELESTVTLNELLETLSICISMDGLRVDDRTPLYSELYPERLVLVDCGDDQLGPHTSTADGRSAPKGPPQRLPTDRRAQINIVKYLGEDSSRACDLKFSFHVPPSMRFYYVHTHRFFCGFMDFWIQFNELQDLVAKSKKIKVLDGIRSRVLLDVKLACATTIAMPMNQTSDDVLLWQADGLSVTNVFQRLSDLREKIFFKYSIDTEYGYDKTIDCLIDCCDVVLSNVRAFEAKRLAAADVASATSATTRLVGGGDAFVAYAFAAARENVFSRRFDLTTKFLRNLDSAYSYNVPLLSIITSIRGLSWRMTTDFYVLMRGVLEKNLGEPLIAVPETIPLEILQRPVAGIEVATQNKYSTLAFRLTFDDVQLNCQVPQPKSTATATGLFADEWMPFGKMLLDSARISFDVFVDGQSELDLICDRTELIDTRPGPFGGGQRNCFPVILQHREAGVKTPMKKGLMSEAHLMMKKDEAPRLTLILSNARVVLAPDWLNDAKEFVLLYTGFVPKYSDELPKTASQGILTSRDGSVIERSMGSVLSPTAETFNVKITLRDSDLYLLENPAAENSFALVASTTALLNTRDFGGDISANLEIQTITLAWCAMGQESTARNQCSNDFSVGIGLSVDRRLVNSARSPNSSTQGMLIPSSKHQLEVEFVKMIGKLSYKDARVVKAVLSGYEKYLRDGLGRTLVPVIVPKGPPKPIDIGRVVLKTDHADLWLLDDFQGSSIPLLRVSLSNAQIEKVGERLVASLTISADYFNQRVLGWEPLVERWSILRFLSHVKDRHHLVELVTETRSTLNVNVTEQLVQQAMQFSFRWPAIRASFERDDFRNQCMRTKSDHLPYVMKNETGCELSFTTEVAEVLSARSSQRKSTNRWLEVSRGQEHTFEFPTRLLLYSHLEREPPRQLIVRVAGWDEISPVNVDACGTYFRIIKAVKKGRENARLLIDVTMEKDGKKVVTIRSSISVTNDLPHPIAVQTEGSKGAMMHVEPSGCVAVPLEFAQSSLSVYPLGPDPVKEHAVLSWRKVKTAGEVCNQTQRLQTRAATGSGYYWLCTSIRREYYPEQEYESLPGHAIHVIAPLTMQNLLPIDMEVRVQDRTFAINAGKSLMITTVDITRELALLVTADRLETVQAATVAKSQIGEGQLLGIRLRDSAGRPLDMYAHVRLGIGQSIAISFWVPYWIVNKSGLPLVIQQDASRVDAAGQMDEHERAKDKNPLMFSFADENCPKACRVRIGKEFVRAKGYEPVLSEKFYLGAGVQALKLRLEHKTLPTLYYNIGVEVRLGTGRYKDTQVVLLTSRFLLQNQSSFALVICHHDLIDRPKEYAHLGAQSSTTWNENYADRRMLCVRRADIKHWSCPFLVDRIGSFHVTMRDADETPRFIRVEIILNSAVFNVTFTDADFYPPPIRIDNRSDVPILYQQESATLTPAHLRTICKARSHVDYAWDDLYGRKRIVLQVFENRSKSYDILLPGPGEPLVYENNSFIQLVDSFKNLRNVKNTDECELVLETMQMGKVMLNKQNRGDGNNGNQLWKLCKDGCVENVGMNGRAKENRLVLDVFEKKGHQLMMLPRDHNRNKYQRWTLMPDGRLCLQEMPHLMLTATKSEVCVTVADKTAQVRSQDGIANTQLWRIQRQRPGSGALDVECLHSGPTVVIRVTDREAFSRALSEPVMQQSNLAAGVLEVSLTMRSGIGVSLINGQYEELIYAHFGGIVLSARRVSNSYRMTASVDVIQVDNQLLSSDRWQVLYCQPEISQHDDERSPEMPAGVPTTNRPALKLEMNCTPMVNYDSFDCFRVKLCDMCVQLDELLLWKMVQMAQATDAAASVQQRALNLPPNTELERHDPLQNRRWYFGTLDLEMGHVALSVVTIPKSGLPRDLRLLKHQFNVKLISFENASVKLPPFRQYHYFETSTFLLETLQKYYTSELQKQTLSIIVTLDAFGNPLGLVTDLKDSFQGLFIEGDVQRFVAGLGYGLSNSVSKVASSVASGVGALTFDQEHELKRRHNMIRSHSTSSTPLTHLYSGVKGLGVGVLGGATAIFTNFVTESKKNGIMKGMIRGVATGAVDTVTKPVQGVFDFVEGTASAMKELAMPSTGVRRLAASSRVRPPRLCRNLYHLLPAFNALLAEAQLELLRINGYSAKERLLDVETCLEQIESVDRVIRQYVLISTKQCYVCRQATNEPSIVIQRIAYKYVRSVEAKAPLENSIASIEVRLDMEDLQLRTLHIWCSRTDVADRLANKILLAKQQYDHGKRTLNDPSSRVKVLASDAVDE